MSTTRTEEIVQAAIALADEQGFDAISMRNVAQRLGAGTMTLYHYVPSKEVLLDLVFDQLIEEIVIPDDELPSGWRAGIEAISRRTRAVFLAHPWIGPSMGSRPQFGPRAMRHVEQSLGVLDELDMGLREKAFILGAADDYTIGFTARELAARQTAERMGIDVDHIQESIRPRLEELTATGEFPRIARYAGEADTLRVAPDERFELGLKWLLDGIEQHIGSKP